VPTVGLGIPQDVSVLGVEDVPTASGCDPALTTVRQSFAQRGATAAELLLRLLQTSDKPAPVTELQEPQLTMRESTGPTRLAAGNSLTKLQTCDIDASMHSTCNDALPQERA
jgi:DNA-binding LacI/PurR family transcriptional regulator